LEIFARKESALYLAVIHHEQSRRKNKKHNKSKSVIKILHYNFY